MWEWRGGYDNSRAWNDGFRSINGDKIRSLMSEIYKGYWAHSGLAEPDVYDYDYDLDGVLSQYKHAEKSFKMLTATLRQDGEEYVVMGTETNLVDGAPFPVKCMFIFTKEAGEWKLLRENIELER